MSKDRGNQRLIPIIRFKGFTDDWEQRKLGDLVNVDTGSRNHQDAVQGGRYPFYVRSENIEALDEYDFDETAILVPGDGRIGEIFHFVQGKFALHQRVYKLDGFTGVLPEFLIQLLRHGFRKHALRMNAQGTVPSLRKPVFTEWEVLIPNTEEQKIISYLLGCLDKTIALHQRKYENLQAVKKELLKRMFASDKKPVPDFRFNGYTNDWEQRKLGDFSEITKLAGFEFTKYVKYSDKGHIPAIRGVNVKNGQFVFEDVKYIDDSDFTKLSRSKLLAGDIVYTYVGTIGDAASVPAKVLWYLAPNVARIRVSNVSPAFIEQILNSDQYKHSEVRRWIATSSQPALSMESVRKFRINTPEISEQEQISKVLSKLDKTITLHQRKLEDLKQLKKVLLQKLFV